MPWDTMDGMRDLLRSSLGRSLKTLSPLDRLLTAWPVACGPALASHGEIVSFTDGIATVRAPDPAWRRQLIHMQSQLLPELRRVAAVDLREIHFEEDRGHRRQPGPPSTAAPAHRRRGTNLRSNG